MCPGKSSTLTEYGGHLGYGATNWKWYSSSCGGTYVGTGSSITVSPFVNTTYYVRAEGYCNTTPCVNVPVSLTCILAAENINLQGSITEHQSSLYWTINSDSKILYMEMERSSDGINYEIIKHISVNDYSDKKGYSLRDYVGGLNVNQVFYRVKVIYASGEIMTSKVLNLFVNSNQFNAFVQPNPATSKTTIEFYASSPSTVAIKLFNVVGQLLQSTYMVTQNGYNSYNLNTLDKFSRGVYFITISNKDKISYIKLIVQ
jgi:hypothetical protein